MAWTAGPHPSPERYCARCGRRIYRKRFPGGQREAMRDFVARRYCGLLCMAEARAERSRAVELIEEPA